MEDSAAMSRPREVSWARLLQATAELAPHWAVPPRLVALVDVDRSTEGRWQVRADRIVAGTPANLALLADRRPWVEAVVCPDVPGGLVVITAGETSPLPAPPPAAVPGVLAGAHLAPAPVQLV